MLKWKFYKKRDTIFKHDTGYIHGKVKPNQRKKNTTIEYLTCLGEVLNLKFDKKKKKHSSDEVTLLDGDRTNSSINSVKSNKATIFLTFFDIAGTFILLNHNGTRNISSNWLNHKKSCRWHTHVCIGYFIGMSSVRKYYYHVIDLPQLK